MSLSQFLEAWIYSISLQCSRWTDNLSSSDHDKGLGQESFDVLACPYHYRNTIKLVVTSLLWTYESVFYWRLGKQEASYFDILNRFRQGQSIVF
jgi:hypothetical protein